MALDASLALFRGLPSGSPRQLVRHVAAYLAALPDTRGGDAALQRVWSGRSGTDLVLYLPEATRRNFAGLAADLMAGRRNPYEVLAEQGILVVDSVRRDSGPGEVLLAGGSCSEVVLRIRDARAVVVKTVTGDAGLGDIDGVHRHRNEAQWLAAASALSDLFPKPMLVTDEPARCAFETPFFPAYSLAELVFQQRLDGAGLADVLISVYERLRAACYTREPIPVTRPDPDRDYLQKIRRRARLLLGPEASRSGAVAALLEAPEVQVNGRECIPLARLLAVLDTTTSWRPVIRPGNRHACHGDLILEDILVDPKPTPRVRLIDPNPYNQHGVFDLAKTMLSLWAGYEFVYFDQFDVRLEKVGQCGRVAVDVALDVGRSGEHYTVAATRFVDYAETELADLLGLPRRPFRRLIRMAAALTALAIPSFHAIRHGKPDRALAFLALGMLHATHALADETPPPFCG